MSSVTELFDLFDPMVGFLKRAVPPLLLSAASRAAFSEECAELRSGDLGPFDSWAYDYATLQYYCARKGEWRILLSASNEYLNPSLAVMLAYSNILRFYLRLVL